MTKRITILFFLIIGEIYFQSFAQITMSNISSIFIQDQFNFNYNKFHTLSLKIEFNDKIKLWNTNQITKAEFEELNNIKPMIDSLRFHLKLKKDPSSVLKLFDILEDSTNKHYLNYLDTIKKEFIQNIDTAKILNLLSAVQDTLVSRTTFDRLHKLKNGNYDYLGFSTFDFYPSIYILLISNTGDSI
jgi:hypothetical protein